MKHVITADWHLGLDDGHDRDIYAGCQEIRQIVKQYDAGLIIAGDVTDKPRPSPLVYQQFANALHVIGAETVAVISGNHDTVASTSTVQVFDNDWARRNGVNFIEGQPLAVTTYHDVSSPTLLLYAPFVPNTDDFGLTVEEWLQKMIESETVDKATRVVLVTHTDIPGAKFGAEREIQIGDVGTLTTGLAVDLIISGHIHKHQHGTLNGVPYFYPGALSRVSHSEENEKKGFVLFDTDTLEWEFIPRKKDRQYITVVQDWKGKLLLPTVKGDVLRLQIKADRKYSGRIDRAAILRQLLKKYPQAKVEIEYSKSTSQKAKKIVTGSGFADYETQWVDDNAKGYKVVVRKKLKQLLSTIDDSRGNKEYSGLVLKEVSGYDYQTLAKVDKKFGATDCVGIVGMTDGKFTRSNGSGKSSFLELIRWVLYGKTRFSKNASAIRDDAEEAYGELRFVTAQGKTVYIYRNLNHNGSQAGVEVDDVGLAKGAKVSQWVEDNFGLSLKTFDSIVYIGNDRHVIVGAKPTDRIKAMQEPLPLDRYEKAGKIVKAEKRELQSEADKLEGVCEEYAEQLDESKDTAEELRDFAKGMRESKVHNEEQVKALSKEIFSLEKLLDDFDIFDTLTEEADDIQGNITEQTTILGALRKPKGNLEALAKKRDAHRKDIKLLEKELKKATVKGTTAKTKHEAVGDDINLLKNSKGGVCKLCGNDLTEAHRKEVLSEKLKQNEQLYDEIELHRKEWRKHESNKLMLEREISNIERDVEDIHEYAAVSGSLKDKIAGLRKQLKKINEKIAPVKVKIKGKSYDSKKLESLQADQHKADAAVQDCTEELVRLEAEAAVLGKAEASLKLAEAKLKKLKADLDVLSILNDALGVKGIPQYIVMQIIEEINEAIPVVVDEFGFWQDVNISIEPDDRKETSTVAIWARMNGKRDREFEGLSNGEREVTNFIIRWAFRRVLENLIDISYGFVLIDEALDVLDEENLSLAIAYFKRAKLQSFCISHSDLRDAFTKLLVVRSDEGVATIA